MAEPSLAQIGFAGMGWQCAAAGGEASALGLPVVHFPMLVGVPKWCGGTAGRLAARVDYVGRWVLGGVASDGPVGEVDGLGVWVCATIASVGGEAFVGASISFVAQDEGRLGAFATSVTIWWEGGPAAVVVRVGGIPVDCTAEELAFATVAGGGPTGVARVSPGVRSFLASFPGTSAASCPPWQSRSRPAQ